MKQEIEQKELGMGNFQGCREKILEKDEEKEKNRRLSREPPIDI